MVALVIVKVSAPVTDTVPTHAKLANVKGKPVCSAKMVVVEAGGPPVNGEPLCDRSSTYNKEKRTY